MKAAIYALHFLSTRDAIALNRDRDDQESVSHIILSAARSPALNRHDEAAGPTRSLDKFREVYGMDFDPGAF